MVFNNLIACLYYGVVIGQFVSLLFYEFLSRILRLIISEHSVSSAGLKNTSCLSHRAHK